MSVKNIAIEIWSDIVCPFCYIGKRHLELAVAEFKNKEPEATINIHWRSFELDSQAPASDERSITEILSKKYGRSPAETQAMITNMQQMGASVGLQMNMAGVKRINTFDLHRLLHFADSQQRQNELKEAFMEAYFVDNRDLSQQSEILKSVLQVGLSEEQARTVLESTQYAEQVRADQDLGREFGIQGVPFFVFNQQLGVSGAQPVSTLVEALHQSCQS